ncbi:MAG: Fibronectin type-III protein, partial [Patescibacteria group bacterium]|nr:Fibronectin type-III protein [Patescibacteria group bacterium]
MKKNIKRTGAKKLTGVVSALLVVFALSTSVVFAAKARLNWDANTEDDLAGYKIYWGTSPRTGGSAPGGYANSSPDTVSA